VNLTPTWLEKGLAAACGGLVVALHAAAINQIDAATARRTAIRR
jgi:hypothetical protein